MQEDILLRKEMMEVMALLELNVEVEAEVQVVLEEMEMLQLLEEMVEMDYLQI